MKKTNSYDFILLYPDNKSVFFEKAIANLNLICLATVYKINNDVHVKAITTISPYQFSSSPTQANTVKI